VHYETNQPTPLLRNTGGGCGQGVETGEGKITPTQHLSHPFFSLLSTLLPFCPDYSLVLRQRLTTLSEREQERERERDRQREREEIRGTEEGEIERERDKVNVSEWERERTE